MKRTGLLIVVAVMVAAGTSAWNAVYQDRAFERLVALGDQALGAGRSYEAIEAFSGALVLRPDSMIAHLKRSETYRRRGALEAALRDLERATALEPTAPRPLELLGDVHLAPENYAAAAAHYERFVALDDRAPQVLYKLGFAYHRDERPTEAVEPLTRAIEMDGRLVEAHYLLGLVLAGAGRDEAALVTLQHAVRLNPALVPVREALAAQLAAAGRNDDRLAQLEALAALEPDRPERLILVGLAYAARGRRDDAVVTLGRAAEQYPRSAAVYTALGRVWLESAERTTDEVALAKALEALQVASADPLATSEAHALWGHALVLAGDLDAAGRALRAATTRFPVAIDAFRDLAQVEERLGNQAATSLARVQYTVLAGAGLP